MPKCPECGLSHSHYKWCKRGKKSDGNTSRGSDDQSSFISDMVSSVADTVGSSFDSGSAGGGDFGGGGD